MSDEKNAQKASYPRFLWESLKYATEGSTVFYIWMTILTAFALVGFNSWVQQIVNGLGITGMSDHVSWGLYIANFTFMVGLAAGAVMMVIPAYLYHNKKMHDVVIVGELLAISAIIMCMLFVVVDLGRPDRVWHMIPVIGNLHWPNSMLAWDIIVLNGYILLNLHIAGYLIYMRYKGETANKKMYLPFVFISIGWAISIHTVTAFLYSGLGGRPFWNTAILAPRFIASAFVTGPAVIIATLMILKRQKALKVDFDGPIQTLISIMRVTILINIFMVIAEAFTQFYTKGSHAVPAEYLFFGHHGHAALVPWIWSAVALNVAAAAILLTPRVRKSPALLLAACSMAFVGIWIEKGMGLIIPGFVPSTLHEFVEYLPTVTEWKIMFGIFAVGLLIYTLLLKVGLAVWRGELIADKNSAE